MSPFLRPISFAKYAFLSATLSFALLSLCLGPAASGQQMAKRLTNQDIIDMSGLGLSDSVIIAKIRSASGADALKFDTSVDGLKALKAAKVSDAIIEVMINPTPPAAPVTVAATPVSNDPNLPPPEVGAYWKDGQSFIFIEGMTITQEKVGGRLANALTNSIRSEHWDAVLQGPTAKMRIKDRRPVFYLYVPDGTSAADFVLVKLEKKSDHREFQVGSFGGITQGKAGVKPDKTVPFTNEHVGVRTYKLVLSADLKPGEYAFFMGTGAQATMADTLGMTRSGGSAGGRVYDFSIPE